ncbi:MAG TPA: dethiobiotin synthase [Verrucomicrobiae bacterium]|nr:dethiobiotin synthase [Verrucomicrobiae bacterium]
MVRTIFITGTDTGVGKTVLTVLLARFLRERGANAAALKPICSGGRDDARKISAALDGALALDEINPWHFRVAIAPSLAAKRENKSVRLAEVLAHVRTIQKRFARLDFVLIEGAGGLLSPLGEKFDSRDLISALRAKPIIVAQNRIGTVNQILLTLAALPKKFQAQAQVVLVSPEKPDISSKTNAKLLAEFFDAKRIFHLPWLSGDISESRHLRNPLARKALAGLVKNF